ncbi:fibronectin type III domain-containing protein [Kordia sp.]|uniref:fibronectin type III domain-containing protein n=1 Tax=Kordia sp. TaxID=1965332 RepID=UPI0025C15CFE|nr:fibronectin type III domain-containing protein [Kordia sp.]MCH2196701.1 fibronectin type III domain-containing protein [Kordia sp.]
MRKTTLKTLFIMFFACTCTGYAQTLNQNAMWPNTNWSLTGTYNADPSALEADPTVSPNFAFDDDDAGNGSDDDIAAESPVIDLTAANAAGETWITISGNFVYNYNTDDILQFEYWDADASTWNIIGQPFNADTAGAPTNDFCSGTYEAYTTEVLNIVAFTPTQLSGFRYRIYFDDLVGGPGFEWGFCFDSPTISSVAPPTCPDPSTLAAANITASTADLSWLESGSATAWDVEIVTTGTAPTGTPTATGVTNPYTAMGLMDNTEYDYYVRANCGGDGVSNWIGPFTFRTACSAFTAPYTENFETFTTAGTAFTSENCWTGTGGAYFWESAPGTDNGSAGTGPDPSITTGNYFYTEASNGNTGDTTDLISPLVDLSGLTTPSLTFNYHMFGGQIGTLDVLVNGTTNVWTLSGQQQASATTEWELATVDLSAFAGQTISVTFRGTSAGTFEGDISIDNVVFDELPTCSAPNALTVTNITDTTANLGWTENGTATIWDVEIVTAGTPPTGTPTATGVTNPYTAVGLTENTEYDFYVRADCGVDGTSTWAGPFTFRTACAPIAAPYTEDFETFTTATTAFISENCWSATNTGGSYFWESAPGTDVGSGGTGPAPSITTGNYFYTEASGSAVGDAAELITPQVDLTALTAPALTFNYHMFGMQIGSLEVIVSGTTIWSLTGQQQGGETEPWELAVVDLAAYAGQTVTVIFRARSAGSFEGDISIDNVSFTELPACPTPNGLTVTNVTDTTADLGWTENGSSTAWDIEIVDVTAGGMVTGTPTVSGVTNPYTAMGLTQNNDYSFYVRADCGGGTFSAWAGPFAFTTLETCPAPSGLTATNIMETTADLGWTENGTATSWNIELVDITAGGTATGTASATGVMNPYMATGLVGDNNYEFYVQADCGPDGVSAWAGPFAFATPYVAVPPDCTNGIFLDSGGNSGDYSSGENITYTICPDMAGEGVQVTFNLFSTENQGTGCYDGLTIHDGADNTAATIDPPGGGTIWCWDRNDTPAAGSGDLQGMTIIATDASGCLTFVFTSDGSVTRPGWNATVTCAPLSVESFESRGFIHYVNTVTNTFVVNAQSPIKSIEVYNLVGQILTTSKPNATEGEANLGSVRNGVYFARVTMENGKTSVVKFVN